MKKTKRKRTVFDVVDVDGLCCEYIDGVPYYYKQEGNYIDWYDQYGNFIACDEDDGNPASTGIPLDIEYMDDGTAIVKDSENRVVRVIKQDNSEEFL